MIDQIKADFAELYQELNGTPLQEMDWIINPVWPSAGIMNGMDLCMVFR